MANQKVGVIGLGNMGGGIARNFKKAGVPLMVWDVSPEARNKFMETAGVEIAAPGVMAAQCAAMFYVVPATPEIASTFDGADGVLAFSCGLMHDEGAVEAGERILLRDGFPGLNVQTLAAEAGCDRKLVYRYFDGADGVLAMAKKGLVVYDFTTSDPVETKKIAARAAEKGIAYLDAGMSGGATGADSGTLTLMLGGDKAAFDRTEELLKPIAKQIFHIGPSGAGHTLKLIHNMVCHTIFLSTCEGGRMAEAAGIKVADMIKVFNMSNARSYASEVRFPKHIISEKWDARSRVYNLRKDLTMAVKTADALDTQVPLGTVTRNFLNVAMDQGMTDTDFSHLYPRFDEIVAALSKK